MMDGVHRGHRHLLEQLCAKAAEQGLAPAIITFPGHPLSIINPGAAPGLLTTASEKEREIKRLFPQAEVIFLDFDENMRNLTAREFIRLVRNSRDAVSIMAGFNNHIGRDRKSGAGLADVAAEENVSVFFATELEEESVCSTRIRNCIRTGDIETAAALLGRPYTVSGIVVHGRKLGRTIGFPTANISPVNGKLIPANGVYLCTADAGGKRYKGVVNIGHRPTVDSAGSPVSIEAHLTDAPAGISLYGKNITLHFIRRLRDEKKFGSLDDLKSQLEADCAEARKI